VSYIDFFAAIVRLLAAVRQSFDFSEFLLGIRDVRKNIVRVSQGEMVKIRNQEFMLPGIVRAVEQDLYKERDSRRGNLPNCSLVKDVTPKCPSGMLKDGTSSHFGLLCHVVTHFIWRHQCF